jgi:hypothetical protein
MAERFQNEVFKARVNIKLELRFIKADFSFND